jgi:hypothetical protein
MNTDLMNNERKLCEDEGNVFSEGSEPERVRAWSAVSTLTKLWVGRATNRAENLKSKLGLGTHPASYPVDTGALSCGTESDHIYYNDQNTAITSLKANPFAKAFFSTTGKRSTADVQRVT